MEESPPPSPPPHKTIKVIVSLGLLALLLIGSYFLISSYRKKQLTTQSEPLFPGTYQTIDRQLPAGNKGFWKQFMLNSVTIFSAVVKNEALVLTVTATSPTGDYTNSLTVESRGDINLFDNIDQGFLSPQEMASKLQTVELANIAIAYVPDDSPLDNQDMISNIEERVASGQFSSSQADQFIKSLQDFGSVKTSETKIMQFLSTDDISLNPRTFKLIRIEIPQ